MGSNPSPRTPPSSTRRHGAHVIPAKKESDSGWVGALHSSSRIPGECSRGGYGAHRTALAQAFLHQSEGPPVPLGARWLGGDEARKDGKRVGPGGSLKDPLENSSGIWGLGTVTRPPPRGGGRASRIRDGPTIKGTSVEDWRSGVVARDGVNRVLTLPALSEPRAGELCRYSRGPSAFSALPKSKTAALHAQFNTPTHS